MKKILVPSDFSDNSLVALTYAIELSKGTGASLAVFHCLLPSSDLVFASLDELQREQQAQKELKLVSEQLRNQVSEAYRKLGMTVPHSTQVGVEINPLVVEKIMDVALIQHADLIVMGTHGASGFRGRLFGSNTSNLVANSEVPVLAIPEKFEFQKIDRIAIASDLVNFKCELDRVLSLVTATNAALEIVFLDFGMEPYEAKEYKAIKYAGETTYKKIRFIRQKATIEQTLLHQLKHYISEQRPQWLVMFPRNQNIWEKILLPSKSETMVNALDIPLLTIRGAQK